MPSGKTYLRWHRHIHKKNPMSKWTSNYTASFMNENWIYYLIQFGFFFLHRDAGKYPRWNDCEFRWRALIEWRFIFKRVSQINHRKFLVDFIFFFFLLPTQRKKRKSKVVFTSQKPIGFQVLKKIQPNTVRFWTSYTLYSGSVGRSRAKSLKIPRSKSQDAIKKKLCTFKHRGFSEKVEERGKKKKKKKLVDWIMPR